MKEIFKQYGGFIIAGIVGILGLALFFGIKINNSSNGILEYSLEQSTEFIDKQIFDTNNSVIAAVAEINQPIITFSGTAYVVNKPVDIDSLVTAKDSTGNIIGFEIEDITDANGDSLLYQSKEDKNQSKKLQQTSSFTFTKPGVYTVLLKATDKNKKVTETYVNLPVNYK